MAATTTGLGGTAASLGAGTYGKIILAVKSAHNMLDKAWLGKSDPYCVVKLADAEIQTHHVKNAGEQCTWDETFAFSNVSPDDVIEFHVYDHNRLMKDAHMGEGSLSMRQVFEEGRLESRVPLTTRSGTKDAGEIWISLRKEGGAETTGAGMATGGGMATTGRTEGYGREGTGVATGAGYGTGATSGAGYEREGTGVATGAGYGTGATSGAGYEREGYTTTERTSGYERREDEYAREAGVGGTRAGLTTAAPAVAYESASTRVPAAASTGEGYEREGYEREGVVHQGEAQVCGREYFTKVEDRPVMKERVTYLKEHRPVEKEFVVETRATGQERETGERAQEHRGASERVVEAAQPVVEQPTAEYFTKMEDRPVVKERVTRVREHRPVEKEFVVETRATGERETGERVEEHMGATERVVERAQPRAPCE